MSLDEWKELYNVPQFEFGLWDNVSMGNIILQIYI